MQGYIKLYRQILDNPIVCKDGECFAIWCYLLLNATHTEYDTIFKGKRITLIPGQLITGRKSIAQKLKVDESKVQRFLKLLEIEQQIEQQKSNKNRLITIINWNKYQENEQQIEQQVNNKRTTSEQQVNTNNNDKNEKNIKENNKKKSYGEFDNVLLTDEEYAKLDKSNLLSYIETLSSYIASKGKKYKSHYATILSWSRKDKVKEKDDYAEYIRV